MSDKDTIVNSEEIIDLFETRFDKEDSSNKIEQLMNKLYTVNRPDIELDEEDDEDTQRYLITPIEHSDDTETGYCQWNLADHGLHVLYNNLDNRLLQVKISL